MSIKIPVQADFDSASVEQQVQQFQQRLNSLGQQIAQANKTQFNPISKTTLDDLRKVNAQFEALRRVQGDLNKRINATGQKGRGFTDLDWGQLYPDQHSRGRQMAKAFEYVTGQGFQHIPVPPPAPGGGGGSGGGGGGGGSNPPHPGDGSLGGAGRQIVNAGLNATGPAGGVAANALNTGMSAGFGAGLMGLLGGMLALGVGKLVSGVMEKIGDAENNNIAYDRLKRSIGDVNVSFEGLKSVVNAGADNLKITYDEAGRLSQQFAKLGNLKAEEYGSIADELGAGVGLSRSFGLDPSQGVDALGQMRGLGVTKDTQDSRRFALLIGETIGKSNAFARSEEVMGAITSFMTSQTRNNMGAANANGYAGMFSSMVGSGIPGMDPAGAGSILARLNASLSAGGAKGEASQFFTGMVGQRAGLSPLQTQVWREGGAFATPDDMFGENSAYRRYMGKAGPKGGKDFYSASRELLEKQYAGDSDNDKLMRANAFSNHTGLNMNQSMAMLSLKPNQMGALSKFNVASMNAAGIGNLAKVQFGTADDRMGVARSFLARDDVTRDEKKRLGDVMERGDSDELKQMLSQMVSTKDQERTQGADIRDSKNALDNIKTSLADKLVPLTQEMRAGIIYMAGGGKMTTDQIMKSVVENDSKGRKDAINGRFAPQQQEYAEKQIALIGKIEQLSETRLTGSAMYMGKPELLAQKRAERKELEREFIENDKKIAALKQEKADLLEKENARLKKELKVLEENAAERALSSDSDGSLGFAPSKSVGWGGSSEGTYSNTAGSVMPKGMGTLASDKAFLDAIDANEKEIGAPKGLLRAQIEQESRFHPNAVSSAGAMGLAQVMPGTLRAIEKRVGRKLDPFNPQDSLIIQKEVMKENYQHFGNWDDATSAYNGGWKKDRWGNNETANYTPSIKRRMQRYQNEGTPAPAVPSGSPGSRPGDAMMNAGKNSSYMTGDISLRLDLSRDAARLLQPQSGPISGRLAPARPFGS